VTAQVVDTLDKQIRKLVDGEHIERVGSRKTGGYRVISGIDGGR